MLVLFFNQGTPKPTTQERKINLSFPHQTLCRYRKRQNRRRADGAKTVLKASYKISLPNLSYVWNVRPEVQSGSRAQGLARPKGPRWLPSGGLPASEPSRLGEKGADSLVVGGEAEVIGLDACAPKATLGPWWRGKGGLWPCPGTVLLQCGQFSERESARAACSAASSSML